MNTSLEKYLHDHLAGAAFAIDLLRALREKHTADGFSGELTSLLSDVEKDREELAVIAQRLGVQPGGMKEGMARFMEKLARPKLISSNDDLFSSFEACETLSLGILGKKALWRALAIAVPTDGLKADFILLEQRADAQHASIEKLRLDLAAVALTKSEGVHR